MEKGIRGPHFAGTWDKTLKGAIPGREKTSDSKEDLGGDTENPWKLVLRNTVCFCPPGGSLPTVGMELEWGLQLTWRFGLSATACPHSHALSSQDYECGNPQPHP